MPGTSRAHLLPATAGPPGHVELPAGAPAAHPDQPEVPHRCTGRAPRRPRGGPPRSRPRHELERVPGPDDAAADHDGPGVRRASCPDGRHAADEVTGRRAPTPGWRRPPPRVVRARRSRCPPRRRWRRPRRRGAPSSVSIPPSTSMSSARSPASTSARTCVDLGHDLGDEALATEAGEHRHAQHEVDIAQVGPHGLEGRVGVEGQPGPQAEPAHLRDQLVGAAHLDVHRAAVGAGVGEVLEVPSRLGHHQVAVEEERRVAAQRRPRPVARSSRWGRSARP